MSGGLMSGGLMSGGRMSGGRLSGGLKSYDHKVLLPGSGTKLYFSSADCVYCSYFL